MDPVIENEMKDHIYLDLSAFFDTFFESVDGLPHLVDAVFARCLQSMARAEWMNTRSTLPGWMAGLYGRRRKREGVPCRLYLCTLFLYHHICKGDPHPENGAQRRLGAGDVLCMG